jgi:hypothetical protein
MKIKLRRDFQGQDRWGAFIEEVAIDGSCLTYRRSTGGNSSYGEEGPWQGEKAALTFIFGPVKVTRELRANLFAALLKLPDLPEIDLAEIDLSEIDLSDLGADYINYGAY